MLTPLLILGALGWRGIAVSRRMALEAAENGAARSLKDLSAQILPAWRQLEESARRPRLYELPPHPGGPNEAQKIYRRALESSPALAEQMLAELAAGSSDALTESGAPLLPLVEWSRLRLDLQPSQRAAAAERALQAAVASHPSILTPELLASIAAWLTQHGEDKQIATRWAKQWEDDEAARDLLRENETLLAGAGVPVWLETAKESWWASPAPEGGWQILSPEEIHSFSQMATAAAHSLPSYAALEIELDGVPLLPLRAGAILARQSAGYLKLKLVLTDADQLFSTQKQQAGWMSALLVCGLLAAVAAYLVLESALARERQLGALKSDFVSSVSHELRAPVASIRLLAENLATGAVVEEAKRSEYHHLIAEECQRLSSLIENVLDFARIEQRRKSYDMAETDVAALARDTIRLAEPTARQRRQIVTGVIEEIDPPPRCDGLAVRQALLNLLDNALKFSPPGSAVTVRLQAEPERGWMLSVQDEGIGIAPAEQKRIFERFYRIGSELRRETQGAGIGLSIVAHIAEAHRAQIEVRSDPGAGSTFTLHFPAS